MALNDTEQLEKEDKELIAPAEEPAEHPAEVPAEEAVPEQSAPPVSRRKSKKLDAEEALRNFDGREVAAPKKRKYGWVGTLLLLAVIGLSIWMMLEIVMVNGDEAKSLGEILSASSWQFALVSVAVILVIMICDCIKYEIVLITTTKKRNPATAIKVAFLGKFYDNVTPFAAGGQPMQIYYLHKKGVSGGASSAVVLIKYMVQMCVWCFVSLVFMAAGTGVLSAIAGTQRTVIMVFGWIGLAVNMILPLSVILFAALPRFARGVVGLIVKAGHKIKIVKDKEKTMTKAEAVLNDYRSGFVIMAHHPVQFLLLIAVCLIDVVLTFAFPYFAMKTLSGLTQADGFDVLLQVMVMNIYVIQAVAIIPTPGNTGAMEGLGALAFSAFVTGSIQFWSMFLWRFGVYYVYLIVGLGITVFDFIRRLVRSRKEKV